MKKIFVTIFGMLLVLGKVYAAGICVTTRATSINGYTSSVNTGNITANRGYWMLGEGCAKDTMDCDTVYVRGEAHCSASGYWPADNWEEYGRNCFCRITHIANSGGLVVPVNGVWNHKNHQHMYATNSCDVSCSGWCSGVAYDPHVIKKMLISGIR